MYCKACGAAIADDSLFCPKCGTKQVTLYTQTFFRNGTSEGDFIAGINRWFQTNPRVANVKCTFYTGTALGLAVNKEELNRIDLTFEVFKSNNENQYGLIKDENFSMAPKDVRSYVDVWKQQHPNVTVVNWKSTTHSRGHIASIALGGVGAVNRLNLYLLIKFPRPKQ